MFIRSFVVDIFIVTKFNPTTNWGNLQDILNEHKQLLMNFMTYSLATTNMDDIKSMQKLCWVIIDSGPIMCLT